MEICNGYEVMNKKTLNGIDLFRVCCIIFSMSFIQIQSSLKNNRFDLILNGFSMKCSYLKNRNDASKEKFR